MHTKILSFSAFIFLFLIGCQLEKKLPVDFVNGLEKIRMEKAPDQRTSVFQIDSEYKDGRWIIQGESSVAGTEEEVRNLISKNFKANEVDFSFQPLPPSVFGDTTHGVVRVSVANLRYKPRHTSAMVDQVLMGMELKLLKARGHWYLVQTPYDYIGWITGQSIERMDNGAFSKWQQSDKVKVSLNFAQVYSEPSERSQIISDAVLGAVFIKGTSKGQWTELLFPDERRGFLPTQALLTYTAPQNQRDLDRQKIIAQAKKMMGIPYLWGGHSTKGMDCSGFTSTVFLTQGYQLPRDANMQVELGEEIIPAEDYSNILPGDLLFFGPGERITHVGICLGGSYYIHESGDVHISSLDEEDELYNAYRKKNFRHIKRIIAD